MKKFLAILLAFCMLGTTAYGAEQESVIAKPVKQKTYFNNYQVDIQGYNIGGYTYFRLRDVAAAVQKNFYEKDGPDAGLGSYAFNVEYVTEGEPHIEITLLKPYEGDVEPSVDLAEKIAIPVKTPVYVDGKQIEDLQGYTIDGYTYYKLRELARQVNLGTEWEAETESIHVCYFTAGKPVIYLYPEESTDVSVKLDYKGKKTVTYPAYGDGWRVTAQPDGTLTNHADGKEYSYLFWEGKGYGKMDFSEGFCVKGEDTAAFLQETLAQMGLTPKEYNEFIVYWLPYMQGNAYNLISFQWESYDEAAKLEITPEPDNLLRVFMAFKALDAPVEIPEQKLPTLQRKGFTVVEWGGTEVK